MNKTRLEFRGTITIAPESGPGFIPHRFEAQFDEWYNSDIAFDDFDTKTLRLLTNEISDAIGRAMAQRALGLVKK